jgi:hypothetical protein
MSQHDLASKSPIAARSTVKRMRQVLVLGMMAGLSLMANDVAKAQNGGAAAVTIPLRFAKTIDAKKAHKGDPVTANTMQAVTLADGTQLPKGSTVRGHITEVRAFSFDPTPYAKQQPSTLAIHFDEVTTPGGSKKINASVRALADRFAADEAGSPHYQDDTDHVGMMELIAGGSFNPLETRIVSDDEDTIGYNRKGGVYARLLAADYQGKYSQGHCDGSGGEQSVAIFSPMACGVYGFDGIYMPANGSADSSGTFRLEARHHNVRIAERSAALLELNNASVQNGEVTSRAADVSGR